MTQKKAKKLKLGGLLIFSVFLAWSVSASAEEDLFKGSSEEEIRAGLDQFFESMPPENPFSQVDGGDFERILPFAYDPFLTFKIKGRENYKQNFKAGENVEIEAVVSFTNDKTKVEIDKLKSRCLEMTKNNQTARDGICRDYNVYDVNSFEHLNLMVQVWRTDESENRKTNGDFLVDEFYAKEDFSLEEGHLMPVQIDWKAPKDLIKGKYYFSFFINGNKKFPILSFAPDIFSPLNQIPFNIEGTKTGGVYIDKDEIEINTDHYFPVNRIPTVKLVNGKVVVKGLVKNTTDNLANADIEYKLYRWTQENEADVLAKKNQQISVKAGGSSSIEYSFEPFEKESFYTLQINVKSGQEKSMLNMALILEGKNRGVFIFLGPVEKESKISPMICLRNATWVGNFKGRVDVSASLGASNKPIAKWSQEGYLETKDGFCLVLKNNGFENLKKGECTVFRGEIYDEKNNLVDQVTTDFYCKKDDLDRKKQGVAGAIESVTDEILPEDSGSSEKILILILVALGLLGSFVVYKIIISNRHNLKK